MKISFIIPVYNTNPKLLNRCIQSIKKLSVCFKEILLINDGSTRKDTKIILKELQSDKEIKIYTKENGGPSSARNMGLDKATGNFVMFVDSDDFINTDYLNVIIESLENCDVDICCFTNNVVDEEGRIIRDGLNSRDILYVNRIDDLNANNVKFNFGVVWGKLFSIKSIEDVRFDEKLKYCEDALFFNQVSVKITKIMGICTPGYNYTINSDSLCHKYNENVVCEFSEAIKKMEKFFWKNNKNKINDFYYTVLFDYYLNNILSQNYFNKKNPKRFYKRYYEAVCTLKSEPFAHVLKEYVPKINNRKFKLIYMLLKRKCIYLSYKLFCYRIKK